MLLVVSSWTRVSRRDNQELSHPAEFTVTQSGRDERPFDAFNLRVNSNQPEFSYDYKEFRENSVGPSPNDPKVPVLNPELDQRRQIEGWHVEGRWYALMLESG